ncbi:hypothetical protein BJ165DRAFT_1530097 [Panaeolus papilionaceus]|nr:hypothetical protein BJ165DRAFT_1530097 [Panaeolus papilionaceus]
MPTPEVAATEQGAALRLPRLKLRILQPVKTRTLFETLRPSPHPTSPHPFFLALIQTLAVFHTVMDGTIPHLPDPYAVGARAGFQLAFIKEGAEYFLGLNNIEEMAPFFRATWRVYKDRWPGPYGPFEVTSQGGLEYILRHIRQKMLDEGGYRVRKGWSSRYTLEVDQEERLRIQDRLDGRSPRVYPFANPLYEKYGSRKHDWNVITDSEDDDEGEGDNSHDDDDDDNEEEEDGDKKEEEEEGNNNIGHEDEEDDDCDVIPVKKRRHHF